MNENIEVTVESYIPIPISKLTLPSDRSSLRNMSGDMYSMVPHSFCTVTEVRSPVTLEILKSISFTSLFTRMKLAGFKSEWTTPTN